MKPAVVFVITFIVATAASTGAKVAMTKPAGVAHAANDSTKARKDSIPTDTALVASGQTRTPPGDSVPRTPVKADSSKPPANVKRGAAAAAPATSPMPSAPVMQAGVPESAVRAAIAATAASDTARIASEQRIAKVFTSMDAKQAAKVLSHMTDNDVQIILGYIGPRPAAAILAELPPERVATLSKLAMQGKKP